MNPIDPQATLAPSILFINLRPTLLTLVLLPPLLRNNRSKPRPRSAAPSYMRPTFAADSAVCAARSAPQHRHDGRPSEEPAADPAAKYVLEEGARHDDNGCDYARVPRPQQGFGVRAARYTVGGRGEAGSAQANIPKG